MSETGADETADGRDREITLLAADIVSAYVSNNSVPVGELAGLIGAVHAALSGLSGPALAPAAEAEVEKPSPAQVRRSLGQDGLISFIDGRAYKTLKRHLTSHGLTPERYRERYGLPGDYPMVAPSYAQQRSALAKSIGLGRPGAQAERAARTRRDAA